MHHFRLTVQENVSVEEMMIELIILKAKVQMILHGDVTWRKMK
jgi:hypothetical protein